MKCAICGRPFDPAAIGEVQSDLTGRRICNRCCKENRKGAFIIARRESLR